MLNIDKLNWNLPEEQQRRQIETLRLEDDGEIETLILPPGKKDCWQNCAIVLSGLDDATLTRFLRPSPVQTGKATRNGRKICKPYWGVKMKYASVSPA